MKLALALVLLYLPTIAAAEWWRETGDAAPFVASLLAQLWVCLLSTAIYISTARDGGGE